MTILTPDAEHELHELRRRAYGPGSEAGLDAHELERLQLLEERVRAHRTRPTSAADAVRGETPAAAAVRGDAPSSGRAPASAEPATKPGSESETATAEAGAGAEAAGARQTGIESGSRAAGLTRLLRRGWTGMAVGVGILLGVSATFAGIALGERAPDVVLHQASDDAADKPIVPVGLDYLAGDPDSLKHFGEWEGVTLWTMRRADDAVCLLLTIDGGLLDWGCALDRLDPQVDLWVFGGLSQMIDADLPVGSTVRFVVRDDTVDVWIDPAGEIVENAINLG
ncbi:hypothetical protein [Microbacterium ulmi]|uniref:Uncharacterized protein n=1 Tax=Microbacterium ulmi TaxID=179095 RepID=A0A7Y2LXD8_9MICO|nr:hypothetical protein [Microbacterium ulmi]NII71276.1 hypothetical protein [Microbacterium ulmi]NNH02580.1 hypothetical protein [Microbacterium ulmi]